MALKENNQKVLDYVREHEGENITLADIAEGTGLEARSVNGIIVSAFQKKGLMTRIEGEIELEDGKHKAVKFIKLTEAGRNFDENAEEVK